MFCIYMCIFFFEYVLNKEMPLLSKVLVINNKLFNCTIVQQKNHDSDQYDQHDTTSI